LLADAYAFQNTPREHVVGMGVKALRITEPTARRSIGIAWRKDRYLPTSVRLFRDFVMSLANTWPAVDRKVPQTTRSKAAR
jgi:DNA-binding transcriptional LysR family regulator